MMTKEAQHYDLDHRVLVYTWSAILKLGHRHAHNGVRLLTMTHVDNNPRGTGIWNEICHLRPYNSSKRDILDAQSHITLSQTSAHISFSNEALTWRHQQPLTSNLQPNACAFCVEEGYNLSTGKAVAYIFHLKSGHLLIIGKRLEDYD